MLRKLALAAFPMLFAATASQGAVVINEVMYRPYNESTSGKYEFVELYNNGTQSIDLGGALFTDSSDFASICVGVERSREGTRAPVTYPPSATTW